MTDLNKQLEIREYLALDNHQVNVDAMSLLADMMSVNKKPLLKASINATHSGRLTNLRVYPGVHVKASVDSFLKPTPKPVLKHHNDDQDPIGRVVNAEYIQTKFGRSFEQDFANPGSDAGSGYIRLSVAINDADAIEKFIDGRFKNVSTRQVPDYILCSVCGDNMLDSESECQHIPGHSYEISKDSGNSGKYKCYMITGPLNYKEVSVVNIPGDDFAEVESFTMDSASSIMKSYDRTTADFGTFVLSDGVTDIDLMSNVNSITAANRKKLTGKAIVAVSPNFKFDKSLANEDKNKMTKTETKNSQVDAASEDKTKDVGSTTKKDSKEDVIVPEKNSESGSANEKTGLSDTALNVTIEALTKSLTAAEQTATDAKAEIERHKANLKLKDEEIKKLREDMATTVADLKMSYATDLLNSQVLLKKPSVSSVVDQESFDKKLGELAGRSVESLKDSIKDLSAELLSLKESMGIKKTSELVADKKITNPVAQNVSKDESEKNKSAEKIDKAKTLNSFFENN